MKKITKKILLFAIVGIVVSIALVACVWRDNTPEPNQPTRISISQILGVTPPIAGETPVSAITGNNQFTGVVSWSPTSTEFGYSTEYTATIILFAREGFTFSGVPANFFTVAGASSIMHTANSSVVTATFSTTASLIRVVNISNVLGVVQPVAGEIPAISTTANNQFTGAIEWTPQINGGVFSHGTEYSATITLTAREGFTFNGTSQNFFHVANATSVIHTANSNVVKAIFPATAPKESPTDSVVNIHEILGVTQPVAGQNPVNSITVNNQFTGVVTWSPAVGEVFSHNIVYTATITLTARDGFTFNGVNQNFFQVGGAIATNAVNGNVVTAVFPSTEPEPNPTDIVVNISNILGVPAPVAGQNPVTTITANNQFTGVVTWSPQVNGTFSHATAYTATITLTALDGFTLFGVAQNFFNVSNAMISSNSANSGIVSAVFMPTGHALITISQISGVVPPVAGEMPVSAIMSNEQFTGVVTWSPLVTGTFSHNTSYTATITLSANQGFSFAQVPSNFFTVLGSFSAVNSSGSGVVTVAFPPTQAPPDSTVNILAIGGIISPVAGQIPVNSITANNQFTGSVVWSPLVLGVFSHGTLYTATITLTALAGFTFNGVQANSFTVAGATNVTNAVNSGVIIATFPQTAPSEIEPTNATYQREEAHIRGNRLLFTIFSENAGAFNTIITGTGTYSVSVNGTPSGNIGSGVLSPISLRRGQNLVQLNGNASAFQSITFMEKAQTARVGASMTYTIYELENGTVGGGATIVSGRGIHTPMAEASGRSAVRFTTTGQWVSFVLTAPADSIVLRASVGVGQSPTIELRANGNIIAGGIQTTSAHSRMFGDYFQYGDYTTGIPTGGRRWSRNPAHGLPRMFFNDHHRRLPNILPIGTIIELRAPAGVSTANPIYVDLAQMELVDAAITAQSGWTLVTGLVANDPSAAEANRDRLWVASNLARNAPARTVFIPAGNFYFCNRTNNLETPRYNMTLTSWHEGITFRGAGIWHTSILGGATFTLTGNNIAFMDMAFHGNEVIRRDNGARALFEHGFGANERGDGFVAHNLWITRYKCGFWFNDGINDIYITSNRVRDVFADGINMRSGAVNSHIVQNSFRNTGDDAIAQWSSPGQNTNTRVRNNTIVVPWLANAIAVYGGRDLDISYNIVQDTTHQGSAINVSRDFGAREFSGNIIVRGNLIERSGSPSRFGNLGAIWINVQNTINPNSLIIEENTILSSTFHAIFLNHGGRIENTIIRNNVINGASHALYVNQGPSGVVNFYGNQIGNITSQNIVSRGVTVDQTPSTGGGSGEPQVPVARVWFFNSGNWAQPRAHAWYYPISPPNYNTLLGSWMGERQNMRRYGATNWWYIDVETHQSTFNVIIRDDTNDQIRRVHVAINEFNRYISWNSLTSSGNVHTSRLAAQNASN